MAANSKIEWTDHTFNPWIGCTKISPGCANCYAESENNRRKWATEGWGPGKPRHRTSEANWNKVRTWNAQAKNAVERPRVFCASLADWLDDEVPITWLADLLFLIDETPNLDWLMLTKRPQNFVPRMEAILDSGIGDTRLIVPELWLKGQPPENVWFGVSTEDQERANQRIPILLKIPARLRWLSCEPLLGPLDISDHVLPLLPRKPDGVWIDWVVVGGESGTNARPCNPYWVGSLHDQSSLFDVPFFFKQWGEYAPLNSLAGDRLDDFRLHSQFFIHGTAFVRVGKKEAGRLLFGLECSQFPEVIRNV